MVLYFYSHFDAGGPELPVQVREQVGERSVSTPTVEGLPEHVTQLFLDTFQQDDFPIEATHGLKQLSYCRQSRTRVEKYVSLTRRLFGDRYGQSGAAKQRQLQRASPVSYTHLTLPTIYSV